jgi:LmbE family N-acetylglucosaminyl deacetylase
VSAPEEQWLAALADLEPPELEIEPPERIVLVAPHPDDHILGIGGSARQFARLGAEVVVVAVTDGERGGLRTGPLRPRFLGRRRVHEAHRAQLRLGLAPSVTRLCVPEGRVERREAEVRAAVESLAGSGTVCASTWRGDHDPDHEAVGRATAEACRASGAIHLEYPVEMWQWARPDDPSVPWTQARAVFLDAASLLAKRAALREYRAPVVGRAEMLERFQRPFEIVFA